MLSKNFSITILAAFLCWYTPFETIAIGKPISWSEAKASTVSSYRKSRPANTGNTLETTDSTDASIPRDRSIRRSNSIQKASMASSLTGLPEISYEATWGSSQG